MHECVFSYIHVYICIYIHYTYVWLYLDNIFKLVTSKPSNVIYCDKDFGQHWFR